MSDEGLRDTNIANIDMKSISVSLPSEVVEAITTEAEVHEFGSRSEYLRYIIERRSQIDSIDQTEVDIVEAIAERVKENNREKISDLEDQIQSVTREMRDIFEEGKYVRRHYDHLDKMEAEIGEIGETVAENQEKIERQSRTLRENQRELRDKDEEIEHLKGQLRSIKSEIRELSS